MKQMTYVDNDHLWLPNNANNIYTVFSSKPQLRTYVPYSSPIVPRKFCHLVAIGMGMNKMAEVDEYLDYRDKTGGWQNLGVLCYGCFSMKWWILNSLLGQPFKANVFTQTPGL